MFSVILTDADPEKTLKYLISTSIQYQKQLEFLEQLSR